MLLCAIAVLSIGCQNRAHTDLYQQRIANEVRVLEDQLYEADYQNRVLQEKVERLQKSKIDSVPSQPRKPSMLGAPKSGSPRPYGPTPYGPPPVPDLSPVPDPGPNAILDPNALPFDMEHGFNDSLIDPGQPESKNGAFDSSQSASPGPTDRLKNPFVDDPAQDETKQDEKQPSEFEGILPPPGIKRSLPLPPPIGGPEPPGKSDTELSPIEPGEILPPPGRDGKEPVKPPGQIQLPDAIQATKPKVSPPERLELHTGLSGGHQADSDDAVDGLYLVINAIDSKGTMVDLESFDIDAELTVAVLDPKRDPSEARIGIWKFSNEEVASFIRKRPISGIHVPVLWQKEFPQGEEVIVHVRLQSGDDEMRCEGRVQVAESGIVAQWMPRGNEQGTRR